MLILWKKLFRDSNSLENEKNWSKIKKDLIKKFGDRGQKAVEGVRKNRVKKYKDFWVVVGDKEHIVINERFCDCEDYLYNISSKNPEAKYCWHALAVKLAKIKEEFNEVKDWYQRYRKLP